MNLIQVKTNTFTLARIIFSEIKMNSVLNNIINNDH